MQIELYYRFPLCELNHGIASEHRAGVDNVTHAVYTEKAYWADVSRLISSVSYIP